jgi:hypothetical protein
MARGAARPGDGHLGAALFTVERAHRRRDLDPLPPVLPRATRAFVLAAALAAAAPAVLRAQPPAARAAAKAPDYSGTWELDASKSNFGPQPGPSRMVMKVRHTGTTLEIVADASTPLGEQRDSVRYTLGGPAVAHDIANVGTSMTSAAVEGGQVVTKAVIQTQGMEIPMNSRWSLAPGGRVLTVERVVTTPTGGMTMQLVYNKPGRAPAAR